MKKKEKFNKKNLRDRLAAILTIYLDGLGNKKRKKMDKYLDSKLTDIVDYYVAILNKKKKKTRVLPPLPADLTGLSVGIQETATTALNREAVVNEIAAIQITPADNKEPERLPGEFDESLNKATDVTMAETPEAEEGTPKYQ